VISPSLYQCMDTQFCMFPFSSLLSIKSLLIIALIIATSPKPPLFGSAIESTGSALRFHTTD
jgi:hypothetical protein